MEKSKLLDVFRSIQPEEWRSFRDFLASPYFNKKEEVCSLGNYLIAAARADFPSKMLQADQVVKKVFPGGDISEKRLAYIMSDLLKASEQFLLLQTMELKGQHKELYLLEACQARDLEKSYNKAYKACHKQLSGNQNISLSLLWEKYRLCQLAEEKFAAKGSRTADPYLQAAVDHLDIHYLTQKLKLSCAMVARQNALNEHYDIRFLPTETLEQIAVLPDNDLARLYARSYLLLQSDNDEPALHAFWTDLTGQVETLAREEVTELFNHGITYCIQQIRKGYRNFTSQLFNLYQEGLSQGFLLDEGILSPWNYKNIVELGLGLRQFEMG